MGMILVRSLSTAPLIREGEWRSLAVPHQQGKPFTIEVRCPECGHVDESIEWSEVAPDGRVCREWKCPLPICPVAEWITLESFGEPP